MDKTAKLEKERPEINKVCIIYNEDKVEALSFYNETVEYFKEKGCITCGREGAVDADLAVVIGGDGTLLRAARGFLKNNKIFVIAVNMGSLGFLTEIKREEAFDTYGNVLLGRYTLEERKFLQVEMHGKKYHALNELVVSKGGTLSKLIRVKVDSGSDYVNTYRADGIIISTPTGSTAYSLSAGGPLISPNLNAMVITPIAPHNLSTRPIVISGDEHLNLEIVDVDRCGYVTIDGDKSIKIYHGETIKIKYGETPLRLVVPENRNYYGVLREKLKWGDGLC